jgi:hypothetical protein
MLVEAGNSKSNTIICSSQATIQFEMSLRKSILMMYIYAEEDCYTPSSLGESGIVTDAHIVQQFTHRFCEKE